MLYPAGFERRTKINEIIISAFFLFFLEMEASKNQMEMDKKAIDELVREKAILNKVCVDMCF